MPGGKTDVVENGNRTARIVDVARRVGVSAMTVSRVLHDSPGVAPSTRERVLAAVADLRYQPNRTARSLRTGRSDRIVVVDRSATWAPSTELVAALHRAAHRADSALEFVLVGHQAGADAGGRETDGPTSGVVIALDLDRPTDTTGAPHDAGTISVLADPPPPGTGPFWSTRDDVAAQLAVSHLVGLGHQRVAHLSGPVGSARAGARQLGWLQALTSCGLTPGAVVAGDGSAESGELAVAALMAPSTSPTAIFVADDLMAVGVLKHLYRLGLRVPDDVAVVGFGDMPGARSLIPGLTTVRQEFDTLAQQVLAAAQGTVVTDEGRRDVPRLLVRESTVGSHSQRIGA